MSDDLEELRNLPPEQRLKKLKELEKKREADEKSAKILEEVSNQQIEDQQEWERKVPLPQLASDQDTALISEEEKLLQREHKLKLPSLPVEEVAPSVSLEETVAHEEIPSRVQEMADVEYGRAQLAQQPVADLYAQARKLQDEVQHQGYMTSSQQEEFQTLSSAAYSKGEAMETGSYSHPSQTARTMMGGLKSMLQSMYQKKEELEEGVKGPSMSQNYQSGR